jgi:uncharacterized membrane protein
MPELHFSDTDRAAIIATIEEAESQSSGEIQVHLENYCSEDVLDRAAEVFATLGMHKTRLRNGVLFYLAIKDHKFAVIGDAGIHAVVDPNCWEEIKESMRNDFVEGRFTEGLCRGIKMAGEKLKAHFPADKDDNNELPNAISFGK